MMDSRAKSNGRGGLRILDIVAVVVCILGLFAWFLAMDTIALVMIVWAIYPDAGDAAIGLIVFGPAVLGVSLVFLLASVVLSRHATHLPMWLRVLMVISPALGCLVGLGIIYRALSG